MTLSVKSFTTREATPTYQFVTNNHVLFHLWWKENLLNHQKVSKYYEHDCGLSTEFSSVLKWFLCYFSNQQANEVATQECGSNSVEDVEFSENISENQSNVSKLFFISPFIDFVQFPIDSMCGSRTWT